jgi:hypothetical protein
VLFALALAPAVRGLGWYADEPWLPGTFALVAFVCGMLVSRRRRAARSTHASAGVLLAAWALASGIGVEPRWVFLGFVAAGAAWLWQRTGHEAILLGGVLAAVTAFLVGALQLTIPGHYPRSGAVLFNAVAFAHAATTLGAALLVRALTGRAQAPDLPLRRSAGWRSWGALFAGLAAAGLLFVWLTVTLTELWSQGERIAFPSPRVPAFDLTLSLSWAAYGLALLGLGLWRSSAGPRWASLAVLLLVIGKVFLRDLGDLQGLARVASLAGLALSLFLVSLLYQRFILGRGADPGVRAAE